MKQKVDVLEPLKASLLTLDWEISPQTIRKFEKELEGLKEKLAKDRYSKRLIELSLPICNYLRVRKGSASPASMQFLHAATRTLHHFRQKRQPAVAERKKAVKNLIDKFEDLMADVKKINMVVENATAAPNKKTPAKKPAIRKIRKQSPADVVLRTIKGHKRGVDIATLKKITGLPDNSIRNILYRAGKEGKIDRISRGVYASA
jgi:DNA-binding protein H-NS